MRQVSQSKQVASETAAREHGHGGASFHPLLASRGLAELLPEVVGRVVPELRRRIELVVDTLQDPDHPGREAYGGHDNTSRTRMFADALLCDDMMTAMHVLRFHGEEPQQVAKALLGPAARLLGDDWRADTCDFLSLTIAMNRMHQIFRQLVREAPRVDAGAPAGTMLLSPVPGEQHGFGVLVVEDAFLRAGWIVDVCGWDEEARLMGLAARNRYDVIALSMSGEVLGPRLCDTVRKLKAVSSNRLARFVVGGVAFETRPELASEARAELWRASDLQQLAVQMAAPLHALGSTGT
jgi:methanogenic corrinoid protein MtbC1